MLEPAEIFTLFFVTLGPLKLLGPFAQRTHGIPDATLRPIVLWTFAIATISIIGGGLLGTGLMNKWHVSHPALTMAGGIVFFVVALKLLLEQYSPPMGGAAEPLPASPLAAAMQLVFPTVITPYGIAAAIALFSRSDDLARTLTIIEILILVMLLDLLAMWFARHVLVSVVPLLLHVLGAILAILQVALAI